MLTLPSAAQPIAAAPPAAPRAAHAVLVFLILALQFGPMAGLLGFRLTGHDAWAWNGAARDMAVLVLLAWAAAGRSSSAAGPALPPSARWALGLVAVYGVMALLDTNGLVLTALNLRRLVLVPLLFVAVRALPWTPAQVDRLFALLVGSSAVVAAFGLAERIAPEALWTDWLDIQAFTAANNFDRFGSLDFHESGRFFSTDLDGWWPGGPFRRVISTYLEPTTLAAAMAVLLSVALARRARGHAAAALVVLALACGLGTLSKGFVGYVVLLLTWRTLGVPSPAHLMPLVVGACGVTVAVAQFHLVGPLSHVAGLSTALEYLAAGHWFGEGIGAAGNYSDAGADFGEESGLGNVIGQVGVAALLSLLWVRALAVDLLATAAARQDRGGPWIASWLVFWTLTYLFSASSLGAGGNALGFVVLALYLHPASGRLAR